MRILKIIKGENSYILKGRITLDDMDLMPMSFIAAKIKDTESSIDDIMSSIKDKLMKVDFPIENMVSAKGFWFRPCRERHWGMDGEYFVEPPKIEEVEDGKKVATHRRKTVTQNYSPS